MECSCFSPQTSHFPLPALPVNGLFKENLCDGLRVRQFDGGTMMGNVELVRKHGFSQYQIAELERLVKEHRNEIRDAWNRHFGC